MQTQQSIPFYRDVRKLGVLAQVIFLFLVIVAVVVLYFNLQRGLAKQSLNLGFGFLGQTAGFQVAEGTAFGSAFEASVDTLLKAFLVGVSNTLRVALIGMVLATALGLVVGIARLSSNWLVNRLSFWYVEVIRNTPLLVQLVFWYFAVILQLPVVKQSLQPAPGVFISNQGLALPWMVQREGSAPFWPWLALAALLGAATTWFFVRQRNASGKPNAAGWYGLGVFATAALLAYFMAGQPLEWSVPTLGNFRVSGGTQLTPEFTALLAALVIYTGAFIAEIVRAGIQSVHKGQWEAARAIGLGYGEALQLIVLPQALRVIIPPLGNQYLNLTKNSSLAVAVGYPDLFNVANTIGNQSGNNVQSMVLILASYLIMSLSISAIVNWYNRATRLVTR